MKDLGETLSLSKGAVTNGGTVSRSSSSSSVDLQFHLTEDSEEETDDRNDSESVHDPKTSKLSATGEKFINMYKDSSEKSLEIVKSHSKELDNGIVESTACSKPNSVKIDEECKHLGSNNSDAKNANDSEKDFDGGETCLQVTADIKESVENNRLTDTFQPEVEESAAIGCNSSLLRSKEDPSLTNGDVKAVTEKLISIRTPLTVIAEPSKMDIAEKDSTNLDAKTSLEQNVKVEKTILISNNAALCSSIDSNNVASQVVSEEMCTSKTSGEDSKLKEEVQRVKELEKECNAEEVQITSLNKELVKECNTKKEVQRTALDKELKEDCKEEEMQRTALDKPLEKYCKDKKEVQGATLNKELGKVSKNKEEVHRATSDKELEKDCKDKEKVYGATLDKELKEYCTDKQELQRSVLDKELEEYCKDKEEMQTTSLDKELEDCTLKEEVQTTALDKDLERDCTDMKEEEMQITVLHKELKEDCTDKKEEEMTTTALDKQLEENCKDKEETQIIALDKKLEEVSKVKEEAPTTVLDKALEENSKVKEALQTTALDKELEEDSKVKEEVHKTALDKELEEDSKDKKVVQRTPLDKETETTEEQSKVNCDGIFPKDNSRDGGLHAPVEKSENSVSATSAHSDVSEDEELTSTEDKESKSSKLFENVDEISLKLEPECSSKSQEVECVGVAKLNVATSNTSVETENLVKKVETVQDKSDGLIFTCAHVAENKSSSAKGDDAQVEEPEVSSTDKSCNALDNRSTNNQNTICTSNSVNQLQIASKNTIIDLCDSADEPGDGNVCSDGSQSDLIIDLDEDNDEAGKAPKSEMKEDTDEVQSINKIPIEQKVKKSDNSEDSCLDMETDVMLVKDDVPEIKEVETSSPPTDKSKGDSTFDMLLKDEINKTSESVCTKEVEKAQQSQADVSTTDIQGSRVSPDRDVSSGFSVHGHKRTSSTDNPIESKKAKLTNGHDTEVVVNSKKDVDSTDLTSEKTCTKRTLEFADGLESKKARVLSIDDSSSNSCASSMSNEHVSKKSEQGTTDDSSTVSAVPRKQLSNIDKAIERVAFAGLDRKERVMMPFIKDLKNRRLQDITIDDLEELVTQRMGEVLSETGENGVLREKVQKLEKMTEYWKIKATTLQKQLSDMTMVFKKLATETKQNSNQMQIPIKITRSVGLQVIMPSLQSVSKNNATQVRNGLPPGTKRKSGGIMTNRNTTPTIHYPPVSTAAVSPNRTPVVQKVVAPSPAKLPQAVPAPKPPVAPAPPPAIRFRAPSTTVTSVVSTGTVMTVAGNLRTAASIVNNRPVVKSVTPRPTSDMLIDLTDEDDKTKRVSSQPLRVAQLNGSPPTLGSTIRFGPPQQLTGIATGVNGQRLTYMLPASAANATSGRLQLFTQQTSGNLRPSGMLTVRPSTQTQTLMLKNGSVVSAATSPSNVIRAASTGTFQQVVARPGQMRTIQPASRPVTSLPPLHAQHPAPLPPPPPEFPSNPGWKKPPPRPDLKISKVDNREQHGIILSWNMDHGTEHEEIASYQLYAYQENNSPPSTSQWKKVGDVKAMPLPMACTLTQFLEGNKYHFAVRAIDIHSRSGLFSIPGHIILPRRGS